MFEFVGGCGSGNCGQWGSHVCGRGSSYGTCRCASPARACRCVWCVAVCGVLQCVVCCSVWCVVCCSVWCDAVCSLLQLQCVAVCCDCVAVCILLQLQCVAVGCECVAMRCAVFVAAAMGNVEACCSLQNVGVAVCCSVLQLQCVAVCCDVFSWQQPLDMSRRVEARDSSYGILRSTFPFSSTNSNWHCDLEDSTGLSQECMSRRVTVRRMLQLQCVAVCCSVLQCVAVCCSVLRYHVEARDSL